MPETLANTARSPQPVTPRLVVSRVEEEATGKPTLARRRSKTESAVKQGSRPAVIEWIDIDNSPPRRSRKKRSNHGTSGSSRGQRSRRSTESEVGGFFPKLARILESGESSVVSRAGTRGSDSRRQRDQDSPRKTRRRDEGGIAHRRAVKHRVGGLSRRTDCLPRLNPSLLSVLSSLTRSSDHSSSSNTTITQQSYDRKGSKESLRKEYSRRISETETDDATRKSPVPNVFDYMEAPSVDGHDGRSIYSNSSSASSHYEPSDAGSSELPSTPSSHSTFPSPTATRSGSLTGSTGSTGSVAELRRKWDPQIVAANGVRTGSYSPETQPRPVKKLPKIRDEEDEDLSDHSLQFSEVVYDGRKRSSSRTSRPADREEERLEKHDEALRHHVAQAQGHHGPHLIDPSYGQQRSHSTSSNGSATSQQAWAQYMAMQRYQYPTPQAAPVAYPPPPQTLNGHPDRPPVPDAPDLTQRTYTGYELLARELSNSDSSVNPIYRKFSYLNHRILLHMQDELQELEEQLRTVDEIIAQMDGPAMTEGQKREPASRRGDAFQGSEMHHRRTLLLGRIFQKTEQYNRAMASFSSMRKDSVSPEAKEVETYRQWLRVKAPIHEVETKFLDSEADLILPGSATPASQPIVNDDSSSFLHPTKHAAWTCLPIGLMLPLLLFSIIPTLAGRLVVTILITIGAILVASTTRIRDLLPANEWAVCGAAYVLVMAAVAGCIPQHAA